MQNDQPTLTLNDGRTMPQLGFGTYKIDNDNAAQAVRTAIDVGYDLIDTASIYGNEEGVSNGITNGVFFTTKVWNDAQGFDTAKEAFGHSLNRAGREDVDLLLIHWPCPDRGLYLETWKAFIELKEEGRAKSIGVSNFMPAQLEELVRETGLAPAVNQVECHPLFQQRELRTLHEEMGIVTQSWSPLGRGDLLRHEVISAIADEVEQPASAVVLRWHLQHGLSAIPKASSRDHMEANFAAVSFVLSEEQMARIDALHDADGRMGPHPAEFC